jgi:hypothetical protein
MIVDPFETIGIIILMGPLIATVGGIVYAIITDSLRGSRPQLRILILSRRNAQDEDRGIKSEV